jgi:hypothetical protein
MNEDDSNLWDQIEPWVPQELRHEYRTVITHLKTFRKSEEILHIFKATGVLGVIIRGAPEAMAKERRLLDKNLWAVYQVRLKHDAKHARRLTQCEGRMAGHARKTELAAEQIARALRSIAHEIDLDDLASAVRVYLQDRIVGPTQQALEDARAQILESKELLQELNATLARIKTPSRAAWRPLVPGFVLVAVVFLLGWMHLEIWYQQSLNSALRQVNVRDSSGR